MAELLNNTINKIIDKLSTEFVYRKLGLCYDYPAYNGNFPLQTLPRANEVCENLPDNTGKGTGMYDCILNNTLLFDGLTSRLEIGFSTEHNEIIFDRLIGGTIRLATVAPKNTIIRGLTGDGRYFYPESTLNTALLWIFAAWRTATTSTVAPESQQKIRNITSRWIKKLQETEYSFAADSSEPATTDILTRLKLAAIISACSQILGEPKLLTEINDLPGLLTAFTLPAKIELEDLLVIQLSLHIIGKADNPEESLKAIIDKLINQVALQAVTYFKPYIELDKELLEIRFDPDWRLYAAAEAEPTPAQCRINAEEESIADTVLAIYIFMFSSDTALLKEHRDYIYNFIESTPWDNAILARSLSALAAIHARGIECGLWDEALNDYSITFQADSSLVAKFLEPDYDNENPDKAGHDKAPKKKPVLIIPEEDNAKSVKKKKRRRRKKPRPAGTQENTAKESRDDNTKESDMTNASESPVERKTDNSKKPRKRNNKNRRNRRKKATPQKAPPQSTQE